MPKPKPHPLKVPDWPCTPSPPRVPPPPSPPGPGETIWPDPLKILKRRPKGR